MPQNAQHQQQAERRLRALDAQPRFRELVDKKLKDRQTQRRTLLPTATAPAPGVEPLPF